MKYYITTPLPEERHEYQLYKIKKCIKRCMIIGCYGDCWAVECIPTKNLKLLRDDKFKGPIYANPAEFIEFDTDEEAILYFQMNDKY